MSYVCNTREKSRIESMRSLEKAYIGKRTSSKFCRVYEKGKQLGDQNSLCTRVELEFKSRKG